MSKKVSFILGAGATALFGILALMVLSGHLHSPFGSETGIMDFAYHLQGNSIWVVFFTAFTNAFGDIGGMITAAIVFVILFFFLHQKTGALWFGLLTVGATLTNTGIKDTVKRARPDLHRLAAFAHEGGMSFPSGHSVFGTLLFGCIFFIFVKKLKRMDQKIVLGTAALLLIFLIMFSRVFVGVHYPSDTLGGFLEGIAFLMWTYPAFRFFNEKNR